MASVVIFETNKPARLYKSVNTPEYLDRNDVVINPDLSQVVGVGPLYWKKQGKKVVEMTATEKASVDSAIEQELTQQKQQRSEDLNITAIDLAKALVRLNLVSAKDLKNAIKEVL